MSTIANHSVGPLSEGSLTAAQKSGRAKVGQAVQMLKKQGAHVQSQLDVTSTQLSSFGKLKSSVSDAQLSAKALGGLTTASSGADVSAAASRFVETFNAAVQAAQSTAAIRGATLAESSGAGRITSDLKRAVAVGSGATDAFKKMGFKLLEDGTMALDSAKFDTALKADPAGVKLAMSKLGNMVEKTATAELGTGGAVAGLLTSFNNHSNGLKAQQNALRSMEQKLSAYTKSS